MLDQEEFEPLDFREEESKDEDEYVEDPRSPRFTQWFAFFSLLDHHAWFSN